MHGKISSVLWFLYNTNSGVYLAYREAEAMYAISKPPSTAVLQIKFIADFRSKEKPYGYQIMLIIIKMLMFLNPFSVNFPFFLLEEFIYEYLKYS